MTHRSQPLAVQPATGTYMLTLCELSAPVRIRTPDSEVMRQFRFFMSRSSDANGNGSLRLHMGYFSSLAEAQKWAHTMRARFPQASAEPVPRSEAEVPVMTDTQVLRVLEARRVSPAMPAQENDVRGISLVGPDDTQTRRVLKTAVIQGAPVQFAVQMFESAAAIDLANVPALSIFRAYTLYKTTITRDGSTWHCLRLGFFSDAISAKQVAYYVRSHFAAVAVVPVAEPEHRHAKGNPIDPASLSDSFQRSMDEALELTPTPPPAPTEPVRRPATPPKRPTQSLEETLDMLAAGEIWNDPDSHSETGVRHLKLEVQKKKSR